MADSSKQVEAAFLKQQGNDALSSGKCEQAVKLYTQALTLLPDSAALFSNRSAAYSQLGKHQKAMEDAEKVIRLQPAWVKGHIRKGQALSQLGRHEQALMAYFDALNLEPQNEQVKKGIRETKSRMAESGMSDQPMLNPFAEDDLWAKLEANPQTRGWLQDPEYRNMIETLRTDAKQLGVHMQDARVMATLGVLLGVDIQVPDSRSGSPPSQPAQPAQQQQPPTAAETTAAKPAAAEAAVGADQQREALKEKEEGNAAYKKKDFETAINHYDKAIELDPNNVTFRTNKAAVFFEQGKYIQSIEECQKAIDVGRENRCDYKLIGKAFARIGNAYCKMQKYQEALGAYNKSLSENRDQEIVKKVNEVQKLIKEQERLAYVDPGKSLEEKKIGNESFQKGDYPTALKHYTEAIKRNPDDAKLFSNRAACYTKLLEFNMALKDCEECIRLDPKFVKGYLRKGGTLLALKQSSKAADAYQKALDIDPQCQEAMDGYRRAMMADNDPEAVKKRAMQDPEVQQILGDPAMQLILQQMQKDPRAIHEHLKNPEVAKKIEKLMEVGLISFR